MAREDDELSREELAARLEGQDRACAIISRTAVPASPALRRRIEAMGRPASRARRGLLAGGAAVAVLAAIALLLLVVLPGGGLGPSVAQAAALAQGPPTEPAPRIRPDAPALLDAAVDGVDFPAWAAEFGWKAIGARSDAIGGRRARTVFYGKEGREVAYTIVSGDALEPPAGDPVTLTGTELRDVSTTGGTAVTWERRGHTCVLSGSEVPVGTLRALAVWRGAGAVGFSCPES